MNKIEACIMLSPVPTNLDGEHRANSCLDAIHADLVGYVVGVGVGAVVGAGM